MPTDNTALDDWLCIQNRDQSWRSFLKGLTWCSGMFPNLSNMASWEHLEDQSYGS